MVISNIVSFRLMQYILKDTINIIIIRKWASPNDAHIPSYMNLINQLNKSDARHGNKFDQGPGSTRTACITWSLVQHGPACAEQDRGIIVAVPQVVVCSVLQH